MSRYDPPKTQYSDFSCFQHHSTEYPWAKTLSNTFIVDPQRQLDWVPELEDISNKYGCIRWFKIRSLYFNHLVDLPFCVEAYREWRDTREDLWLDAISNAGDIIGSIFVVAAKRGNKWYKERLNRKFSFFESLPPIHFFCEDWGRKATPMLFITLTVDPALVNNDLDQAWDQISMELHLFETKLRQEYGKFVKLRVWEAHASGWPHVHIVYYFLGRQFEVWEHFDKNKGKLTGNRSYRVSNAVRDKIRSFWGLGSNVDIQGVSDTIGALSEVRKYVTKTIWSKKGDLTSTLCCLHNKQVYWLSQCDYVKMRDKDPELGSLKTVNAKAEYLSSKVPGWAKKDFIGAIWGSDCYMDFYKELHEKGFVEGLAEPGLSALVMSAMHNCNKELPEFDHFEYRGCFKHQDLEILITVGEDPVQFVDPPPEDTRLYFGVDHVFISGGSGRNSSKGGFFEDPDKED